MTRSLEQAVRADDGRAVLRALRRELAKAIVDPETSAAAKAALGRELRMTQAALDGGAPGVSEGDDLDELTARREARLSG